MAARFFPIMFVLLWATGFIGAGLSMPYAEPFTFMAIRFSMAALVMIVWSLVSGAEWPKGPALWHAIIAGCLIHGVYLACLFWAVRHGLPAGLSGLLAGIQPMLITLIAAFWLREKTTMQQWAGLLVGFLGVILVMWPKVSAGDGVTSQVLLVAFIAVLGISIGTVWQKRFGTTGDLKAGTAVQYVAAALFTAVGAFTLETRVVIWSSELIFALLWLTFAISIGAILALLVMIREGALSKVASLFYLVPGTAAIMAYLIFGQTLSTIQFVGMIIATLGVALTTLRRR